MRKKLFSCVCVFAFVLGLSLVVMAQDKKESSWTGNIIDKACSAKATTAEAAAGHKKGCALSPGCSKSGYGVFADGKYTEFDEKGNELAKAALEKTAKASGAKFKVTGKVADGKLKVESITEVE
jgi:hypothetical protein